MDCFGLMQVTWTSARKSHGNFSGSSHFVPVQAILPSPGEATGWLVLQAAKATMMMMLYTPVASVAFLALDSAPEATGWLVLQAAKAMMMMLYTPVANMAFLALDSAPEATGRLVLPAAKAMVMLYTPAASMAVLALESAPGSTRGACLPPPVPGAARSFHNLPSCFSCLLVGRQEQDDLFWHCESEALQY